MLLFILAILLALHQTNALEATEQNKGYNNSSMLYSFICDDEILKNIGVKLAHIEKENQNLHLKMDTMTLIINHQFIELKTTITTSSTKSVTRNETTNGKCDDSNEHLIDVRGNFSEANVCATPVITSNTVLPSNCAEALQQSGRQSGIHKIRIAESKLEPFFVYCMLDPHRADAAWTIIQRRMDGTIDFYRKWVDYQQGFGNLEGEFFIGLDKLHALTQSTLHELWIKMEDFENVTRSANYSSFAIGGASDAYALNVLGSYSGDAGNSLTSHAGHKFTTQDMDNDIYDRANCAIEFTGGWWYHKCHNSNLNGQYLRGAYAKDKFAKGVVWHSWHEFYYSLKYVHMAIRSVSNSK